MNKHTRKALANSGELLVLGGIAVSMFCIATLIFYGGVELVRLVKAVL